jgi:hypothetical protein
MAFRGRYGRVTDAFAGVRRREVGEPIGEERSFLEILINESKRREH